MRFQFFITFLIVILIALLFFFIALYKTKKIKNEINDSIITTTRNMNLRTLSNSGLNKLSPYETENIFVIKKQGINHGIDPCSINKPIIVHNYSTNFIIKKDI